MIGEDVQLATIQEYSVFLMIRRCNHWATVSYRQTSCARSIFIYSFILPVFCLTGWWTTALSWRLTFIILILHLSFRHLQTISSLDIISSILKAHTQKTCWGNPFALFQSQYLSALLFSPMPDDFKLIYRRKRLRNKWPNSWTFW